MHIIHPDEADAVLCLRAMKAVLGADGVIGPVEEKLIAAAQVYILRTDIDFGALTPIGPADLAAKLTDPGLRRQLVGAMVINSFASGEAGTEQLEAIESFAAALEVQVPEVQTLRRYVERNLALLRFDVIRRMYIGDAVADIWRTEGVKGILRTVGGLAGLRADARLAAKYIALGELPAGTLGRSLFDFYRSRGFALPGEKNGGPEKIILHDMVHVLSGYSTEPDGEFEVAAFTAGFRRAQSLSILLFVLCQFDAGVRMAPVPGAGAQVGLLEPDRFFAALVRGSKMTVDVFADDWDFWAAVKRPVSELRAEYGIEPA